MPLSTAERIIPTPKDEASVVIAHEGGWMTNGIFLHLHMSSCWREVCGQPPIRQLDPLHGDESLLGSLIPLFLFCPFQLLVLLRFLLHVGQDCRPGPWQRPRYPSEFARPALNVGQPFVRQLPRDADHNVFAVLINLCGDPDPNHSGSTLARLIGRVDAEHFGQIHHPGQQESRVFWSPATTIKGSSI